MSAVAVIGAGPAGASLALLLAQRGVNVALLEQSRDFGREFRGEVLMPSGQRALAELGIPDTLAEVPSTPLDAFSLHIGSRPVLEVTHSQVAEWEAEDQLPRAVSQPVLLKTLVDAAKRYPNFCFHAGVSIKQLVYVQQRVCGVRCRLDGAARELQTALVVGADDRNSWVRRALGLGVHDITAPMDIVWFKLPLPSGWEGGKAYASKGHLLFAYRTWDDSLQLGWVITKGTFGAFKEREASEWVAELAGHVDPALAQHLAAYGGHLENPFLLSAKSDCVARWSAEGALLIGDAAHTMSPVGGQGINIALRDAIVAANHLVPLFGSSADNVLDALGPALLAIEQERMAEVRQIQRLQSLLPRIVLNKGWLGATARSVMAWYLSRLDIRQMEGGPTAFLDGITDVRLTC